MAPELMNFTHAPSFAVDVYSFGVVLHHIITGDEPDHRSALRALRHGPYICPANISV
jgi:serine/threonine protein kinase